MMAALPFMAGGVLLVLGTLLALTIGRASVRDETEREHLAGDGS